MNDVLITYQGVSPQVGEDVLLAPGAKVIGSVTLEKGVSIWYNAVIRGDDNSVLIKEYSNIQDGCVVHVDSKSKCQIGKYATIGHQAIVHACTIEDYCLIGMGAVILNDAQVGEGSVIGAGAIVTAGSRIPPYSVAVGSPAKVIKTLDPSSKEERLAHAENYYKLAMEHKKNS